MPQYPVIKHDNFIKQYKKYQKQFHKNRLDEIIEGLESILVANPLHGRIEVEDEDCQMFSIQPYNSKTKTEFRIVWFFNGESVLLFDIYPLPD